MCVIVALLLASCAPAPPPVETPTSAETVTPPPPAEKVTLRLWSHISPGFIEANETLIAKFMEENPNIEIKYETFDYDAYIEMLHTAMAGGTEADVMEMFGSWVYAYAKGGRLAPVPESVITLEEAKEIFYAAPLEGYVYDGRLYGLPNEFNIENGAALVNPAMFEEAGLEYPPQWESWDDLIADAKAMTKYEGGVMTVAGFDFVAGDGVPFILLAGILQKGGDYWAEDGAHLNLTSPEAKETLQWMVDVAQVHKVVDPVVFNDDENWVGDAFFMEMCAIGFVGPWMAAEGLAEYPDFEFDYIAVPHFGDEPLFAADSGWGKVVSVSSPHQEEAWKLVQFMALNEENAEYWNTTTATVPAQIDIAERRDILEAAPWIEPDLDILQYGRYIGPVQDRDMLWYDIIYQHGLLAMQGIETVDEACAAMEEEGNAMIDEALAQ